MTAERTIDATGFMDLCAALGFPRADVVRGVVEDFGFDHETAELAVSETFERRRMIDAADAAVPTVDDMIAAARELGKGDALVVREAEQACADPDAMVPNDIVLRLRELLRP